MATTNNTAGWGAEEVASVIAPGMIAVDGTGLGTPPLTRHHYVVQGVPVYVDPYVDPSMHPPVITTSVEAHSINQLTNQQLEALACALEECSEVVHIIGKTLRHGLGSRSPIAPEMGTNMEQLEREFGDVMWAMQYLISLGIIREDKITRAAVDKSSRVKPYLHYKPA